MTGHIESLWLHEDLAYVTHHAGRTRVAVVRKEAVPDEVPAPHDPRIIDLYRDVTRRVSLSCRDAHDPAAQVDFRRGIRLRDDQVGKKSIPLLSREKPVCLAGSHHS